MKPLMRRFLVVLMLTALTTASGSQARTWRVSAPMQAPTFQPALGWWILTTGPTNDRQFTPETWAASDPDGLQPDVFDLFKGLRGLSREGILIWASNSGRGGPTRSFIRTTWPLRLPTFRVDHGWEGQPAGNVQQRLRWASVSGWHLDVRVYFGTQHPSTTLLKRAQAELDRLRLPSS